IVLPYLDLMVSTTSGLSADARDLVLLLQENPELVWVGFRDPLLPLPPIVEELAPYRLRILGVERSRLGQLITRKGARKFGVAIDLGSLYQQVSGINAVRLRRLFANFGCENYPPEFRPALVELRRLTLEGRHSIPTDTFDDLCGYSLAKQRLKEEILE